MVDHAQGWHGPVTLVAMASANLDLVLSIYAAW
jgi:hypothetical protein